MTTWVDESGTEHAACAIHVAERQHRYPVADPPRPVFLHEDPEYAPDPIDEYKSWTDAGWTEAELAVAFGR